MSIEPKDIFHGGDYLYDPQIVKCEISNKGIITFSGVDEHLFWAGADLIEKLTPVPLTPELLVERLGFESNDSYGGTGFINGNMIVFRVTKDNEFSKVRNWFYEVEYGSDFEDRTNIVKRMDYLHQLQLLWYALTGQPLTLKDLQE